MTIAKKEIEEGDLRWLRVGRLGSDRPCDKWADHALTLLPGTGILPKRWVYGSREEFRKNYGGLGPIVWACTASYTMLLIDGIYVFRLWTDSSQTMLADVCDSLAKDLEGTFEVFDIPENALTKTKPLRKRIRVVSTLDIEILLLQTIVSFGVT